MTAIFLPRSPRLIESRLCVDRRRACPAAGRVELRFHYNLHIFFKA